MDPWTDPNIAVTPPEASAYDVQKLREIEISSSGQFLFVTSAQGLQPNDNDWLLVYNESSGAETRIKLNTISSELQSPAALLTSVAQPGRGRSNRSPRRRHETDSRKAASAFTAAPRA